MSRKFGLGLALVVLMGWFSGCGDPQPPIVRVGTNVVEKSIFQGSWYMSQVVVDTQYEAGSFPGDAASDATGMFAMPRIRWVIDENFLFAYRDYEIALGGQTGQWRERDVQGHPVAAFRVLSHFDIRRAYNTTSGEELNTVVENATDRRWYERKYMRVDWSMNLLPGYFGIDDKLEEVFGAWRHEPAPLVVAPGSALPESWRPRFDRMQCASPDDTACAPFERDFSGDYAKNELYHMSFVTQEVRSPGDREDPFTGRAVNGCVAPTSGRPPTCAATAVFLRTSFLKVSPRRQYVPVNWSDTRWDRHGYFRLAGRTIDRSTGAPSDPAYGQTDFLNYAALRHNLWKSWYTLTSPRVACERDEECAAGSACLRTSEGRWCGTETPHTERAVRPIVWYTTPELPAHLVQSAHHVLAEWNAPLMATVRRLREADAASYPRVPCQSADPSKYCYCRRAEGDLPTAPPLNPTCAGRYDPFESPDEARARGVAHPYDCYVAASGRSDIGIDRVRAGCVGRALKSGAVPGAGSRVGVGRARGAGSGLRALVRHAHRRRGVRDASADQHVPSQ